MEKLINQLKLSFIEYLNSKPQDIPYLISRDKKYTVQELIVAIQNNDDIGVDLIRNAIILSIDRFDRLKENFQDFNKL